MRKQLSRLFADRQILRLLYGIIDSHNRCAGQGLPIGNLTSQYFANHYLSALDHFIIEKLKPKRYVRYMDDMVLWTGSIDGAWKLALAVQEYCLEKLQLILKAPVINSMNHGLPFLGFLIKPDAILLAGKSRKRARKRVSELTGLWNRGLLTEEELGSRALGVSNALAPARSRKFRATLWNQMILGDEPG